MTKEQGPGKEIRWLRIWGWGSISLKVTYLTVEEKEKAMLMSVQLTPIFFSEISIKSAENEFSFSDFLMILIFTVRED